MSLHHNSKTTLIVAASLLVLILCGCSQNDVTAPADEQILIAADPLDDVLKSTDGMTPADPQDRLARLAEVLGLDAEQLAALTVAYTDFRDGIASLRTQVQDGELTVAEAREAAAILRDAFEAELQIILTAEQWDLLQEMRQNRPGPHGGNHGAHDRWAEWLTEIGADEAQVTAVFELLDTLHAAIQDLRDQVRAGEMTREDAHVAATELRAEFDEDLQVVLTEEQYAALLALRPDCRGRMGGTR